jgi:hypothetical protein
MGIDTWTTFATKIIEELKDYDTEHKTDYAYFLTLPEGAKVLGEIMLTVDKKNYWQPMIREATND